MCVGWAKTPKTKCSYASSRRGFVHHCRSIQVRITYEERHPGDWGGFKPKVVVEYDERNHFLMAIEITYNKREANKNFAYNHTELKEKIQQELDTAQVTATDLVLVPCTPGWLYLCTPDMFPDHVADSPPNPRKRRGTIRWLSSEVLYRTCAPFEEAVLALHTAWFCVRATR